MVYMTGDGSDLYISRVKKKKTYVRVENKMTCLIFIGAKMNAEEI